MSKVASVLCASLAGAACSSTAVTTAPEDTAGTTSQARGGRASTDPTNASGGTQAGSAGIGASAAKGGAAGNAMQQIAAGQNVTAGTSNSAGSANSTSVFGGAAGSSMQGAAGRPSAGGVGSGGVSVGGSATAGGAASGGVQTSGTAGRPATGGGASTGGVSTGGTATGGVSTGGTATGGVSTGGTAPCVDDGKAESVEFTHGIYGCGHRFGALSSPDYWVAFDSGLNYDKRTGYGWLQLSSFHTQSQGAADCQAATAGGITSWQLPTIAQVRTLVDGCAPNVLGGTCRLGDSCLAQVCGTDSACTSCQGGSGPNPKYGAYERANIQVSTYTHTTSMCTDCPSSGSGTEWIYQATNGYFVLFNPEYQISATCVTLVVPNY